MSPVPKTVDCSWCGRRVEPGDGFRVAEHAGARRAAFCRLEHVVPWTIQGPHWEPGDPVEPSHVEDALTHCAWCGGELPDTRVVLIRHRAEHRIPDGFCSVDHLAAWAKAGGRFA